MKRLLIIDADSLAYRAAAAIECPIHWGDDLWTLHADAAEGRARVDQEIESLKQELNAQDVILCLTDSANWRKDILPSYKANRKEVRKPIILKELRRHMLEVHKARIKPTLEADDLVGIVATDKTLFPKWEKVIVSIDKDLKSIPSILYNQGTKELKEVSLLEADRFHMIQTLSGDAVDGYSGCPSVGKIRAERMLESITTVKDMWEIVKEAYAKAGLGEEEALTQAQVARILRSGEYDMKTGKVKLWKAV